MAEFLLLCVGAFLAGWIDAIVGGGGLIQVPMLFSTLVDASPASLFGTNKLSSVWGTGIAAWRYGRRIGIPWRTAVPAAATAFGASYGGAMAIALLPKDLLRPLVLVLLVGVAVYTFRRKDFGVAGVQAVPVRHELLAAMAIGGAVGFYDGFFGPGAGSFLIFLFVRFLALDFLTASAAAKIVNVATNFAALCYFVPSGNVLWHFGIAMAVFNIAGSLWGAHLVLRHGSGFVRRVFLGMAIALILKFAYDTVRQVQAQTNPADSPFHVKHQARFLDREYGQSWTRVRTDRYH